jgi:phytoene dehydrogenase-like protein
MSFPFTLMTVYKRPSVSFLGAFSTSSTGMAIGQARPDRIVVVAAQREDDSSTTCPMPTINGVTASTVYQGVAPDNMCIGYAVVPTGTTVSVADGQTRTAAWVIQGASTLEQSITNSGTGTSIDLTGTMPQPYGVMIGIARSRSTMSTSSVTTSGLVSSGVKDTSTTSGGGSSGWVAASALTNGAGSGTMTLTNSTSYSSGIAAAGVFI